MFRRYIYLLLLALAGLLFACTSMAVADTQYSRLTFIKDSPIGETVILANEGGGLFGWKEQYTEWVATRTSSTSISASAASKNLKTINVSTTKDNKKQRQPMTPNAILLAAPNAGQSVAKRDTPKLEAIEVAPKLSDKVTSSWFPATPNAKVSASPNMIR